MVGVRTEVCILSYSRYHPKTSDTISIQVCSSVSQALDGRAYDYVVITTKSVPEMMRAPTLLAPFLSDNYFKSNPQPTYLFLQNGLNVEKDMYNAIVAKGATPKIISTALWIGTNMFNDNVVEHSHHVRLIPPSLHILNLTTPSTRNVSPWASTVRTISRPPPTAHPNKPSSPTLQIS